MSCVFANSVLRKRRSEVYWVRLFRIDAIFMDCLGNCFLVQYSVIRKRLERSYRYVAPVDLEVITQCRAAVAASVAVRSQGHIAAWYPTVNLICNNFHVIGRSDVWPRAIGKALFQVTLSRFGFRVQVIPALRLKRIAA